MKKILLVSAILLSGFQGFSQNVINAFVWEANTKSGGKFIGVANDEFEAENVIDEIKFEYEGTKYEITSININESVITLESADTTIEESFISDHDELEYKYISEIELLALEYVEDNDVSTAISFYTNVSRQKSKDLAKKHLESLHKNYSKYLFNVQTPEMLVSYSE